MNAFSKPINTRPDLLKVIHGRKQQPHEYVEYRPCNTSTRWAASPERITK